MLYDPSKEYKALPALKEAKELGLSEKQYDALVKALAHLEDGKIRRITTREVRKWEGRGEHLPMSSDLSTARFNMSCWVNTYEGCGTACCIGGLAEMLVMAQPHTLFHGSYMPDELERLFYPYGSKGWEASPQQAAVALRGYLTTGQSDWPTAMAR